MFVSSAYDDDRCLLYLRFQSGDVYRYFDVSAAQVKEARIENVFRYAHVYPRAIALMGSGMLDVKPLITNTFVFEDSIAAFDFALHMPPDSVKVQITLPQ